MSKNVNQVIDILQNELNLDWIDLQMFLARKLTNKDYNLSHYDISKEETENLFSILEIGRFLK